MVRRSIGTRNFNSRRAAEDEIRRILYTTCPGDPVRGDDLELITNLLHMHPEVFQKIGAGVEHITTHFMMGGTRAFWICRVDGTETDFSFRVALDGYVNHEATVRQAMRDAVRDQIEDFRTEWFRSNSVCSLTGKELVPGPEVHVDHVDPQFVELADRFAESVGGYAEIPVESQDGQSGSTLSDEDHVARWREFHADKAVLRVVHASANLRRPRVQRK